MMRLRVQLRPFQDFKSKWLLSLLPKQGSKLNPGRSLLPGADALRTELVPLTDRRHEINAHRLTTELLHRSAMMAGNRLRICLKGSTF